MKKYMYSLCFLILGLFSSTAQTYKIDDFANYTEDCDPSQIILATETFTFNVNFDPQLQYPNLGHQFFRDVYAVFRDGAGNVVQDVLVSSRNFNGDANIAIGNSTFAGLGDGTYFMSLRVEYRHIINNPYNNPLKLYDNGTFTGCNINFTNPSQSLICELTDVFCFTYNNCDDVSVSLYPKNGEMRSSVNPSGGNYSYQWYIFPSNGPKYPAGTSDRVDLIDGCALYSLRIVDLDTGCTYFRERNYCQAIEIDIPQCLIGVPSGLGYQITQDGSIFLNWADTPGAFSYTLVLIHNDPDCCTGIGGSTTQTIQGITSSHYQVDASMQKSDILCFSWRVIANCQGPGSTTSGKECARNQFKSDDVIETRGKTSTETSVSVYPNPTSYELNIDAENLVSDHVAITIVSLQGQSVFNTTASTEAGSMKYTWTPQANIPAGVYFVNVIDQGKVINKRFVIIK